jgi:L-phenylalanine/L-methionine N-acetyltransferase
MLRKATIDDIPFLYYLYMHDDTNPFLLYEKMDLDVFRPIIADLISKGQKFIYLDDKGEQTGMCKLYKHTFRCAHIYYLGGLAIDPAMSGRGFGKNMMSDIIDFCWSNESTRIELSVMDSNQRAIKLYESCGFEKEGLLRNYGYSVSEGRYFNEIMMSILK